MWLDDAVAADRPSDPFLFGGYASRSVHLVTDRETTLTFELDAAGDGHWAKFAEVAVDGYAWHRFDNDVSAAWIRVRSSAPLAKATAWFTYAGTDPRHAAQDLPKFAGIARAADREVSGGVMRARREHAHVPPRLRGAAVRPRGRHAAPPHR